MRTCKYMNCEGCTPEQCPSTQKCRAYKTASRACHAETERVKNLAYYHEHKTPEKQAAMRIYAKEYRKKNIEVLKPKKHKIYLRQREKQLAKQKAAYMPVGQIRGYLSQDGTFKRTHSLSESIFAVAFEDEGIEIRRNVPTFNTPTGKYTPDFYLPKYNLYVEVKAISGDETYMAAKERQYIKIAYLRAQGMKIAYMDATEIQQDFFGEYI